MPDDTFTPQQPTTPFPATPRRRRRTTVVAITSFSFALTAALGGAAGWAVGRSADHEQAEPTSGSVAVAGDAAQPQVESAPWQPDQSDQPDQQQGFGSRVLPDRGTDTTGAAQTAATDEQEEGVVLISTTLNGGSGAGTGIILDTDGTVLTNYHVVDDSTSISVTVAGTGETYDATVEGYDEQADVALLSLDDATGLTAMDLDTDGVQVGEDVTTIGNSEGGGTLLAASGQVTALEESITTSDTATGTSSDLEGLIENSVYAVPGDSGGPLVDGDGEVVGITTATTSGGQAQSYAVPIDDAMAVVDQIESGVESASVRIGPNGYLGVSIGTATGGGVTVVDVPADTPAAEAGLAAGDVITAIDGTAVSDPATLAATISDREPGDRVTLTWTDASGADHSQSVTLGSSPIA